MSTTRLADAIMNNTAYASGRAPMSNLAYGGVYGYAPNLAEWASTTHYVRRNLQCLLIDAPKGFSLIPGGDKYTAALKAMFETHSKTIDGYNSGLDAQFTETAAGLGGEKFQDVSNVTRAVSEPSFGMVDLYGRPIQNLIHDWMTLLMMDPVSKIPGILSLGIKPTDWLNDMAAATVLVFEPDPTFTKIQKAYLTTNMMPKATGDISGKKDKEAEGELSELTIAFTGVTQVGLGVNAFAQKLLDTINLTNANPYLAAAFAQDIGADVKAATTGWAQGISSLASGTVNRV